MINKCLLINPITYPSLKSFIQDSKQGKINCDECISLMLIQGYCKKHLPDIQVKLYDWHFESCNLAYQLKKINNTVTEPILWFHVQQCIEVQKPDLIGISALYELNSGIALDIAKRIKEYNPAIKVVMGGIFVDSYDSLPNVDYLIKGEGEQQLVDLINKLNNNEDVKQESYQQPEKIHYGKNPEGIVKQLHELNWACRDDIQTGQYGIIGRTSIDRFYKPDCRVVNILTSRGCFMACTFCSGHLVTKKNVRFREIDDIIAEMKYLIKEYGIEVFQLQEENANINLEWSKSLYREMAKLHIKWVSNAGFYVSNMDQELVQLAIESGLVLFNLAMEYGSKRMLKILKKSEKIVDNAHNVIKWIREIDNFMYINTFWMFGFAEETWDDVKESIEFMKTLDADWFQLNILQVFKGSEIYYDYLKQGNYVEESIGDTHYLNSTIKNSNIDPKELTDYVWLHVNEDLNFRNNRTIRVGNWQQAYKDMKHVVNISHGKNLLAVENLKIVEEKLLTSNK